MSRRTWDEAEVGDAIGPLSFPVTVARLVIAAAGNRDFSPIHHNHEYAQARGTSDMYANNMFLQGMWERAVRDYIGLAGTFRKLAGFRMVRFNTVGTTVVVKGEVVRKWREGDTGLVEIKMWSENDGEVSVGPGTMTVTLPLA